ncbi:zinc finger protein castor homolog 1-like [Myotis lucifugus]|uniref:zinc finger protein castor homolog 1-like n=1 Tax=Myotis lucifugus TaxID=59463 RepID=UPI000CCC9D65|nr:zinc finger protein castor homolog 1-like [Myotis lucifugus]
MSTWTTPAAARVPCPTSRPPWTGAATAPRGQREHGRSATLGATRGLAHPISSQPSFPPVTATPPPVKSDVPLVQDAAGNTISMPTALGAKKRLWINEGMSRFGKSARGPPLRKMLDEGMMLGGFPPSNLTKTLCPEPTSFQGASPPRAPIAFFHSEDGSLGATPAGTTPLS